MLLRELFTVTASFLIGWATTDDIAKRIPKNSTSRSTPDVAGGLSYSLLGRIDRWRSFSRTGGSPMPCIYMAYFTPLFAASLVVTLGLPGCSSSSNGGGTGGSSSSTFGGSATGGSVASSGGTSTSSANTSPSTGGSATGGSANSGGTSATTATTATAVLQGSGGTMAVGGSGSTSVMVSGGSTSTSSNSNASGATGGVTASGIGGSKANSGTGGLSGGASGKATGGLTATGTGAHTGGQTGGGGAGPVGGALGSGGVVAAGGTSGGGQSGTSSSFKLTSTELTDGGTIPTDATCESSFASSQLPPLVWKDAPTGTKSFAMVFVDETLIGATPPNANGFHSAMWDIPSTVSSLPQGLPAGSPPAGVDGLEAVKQKKAPSGEAWLGPCPNYPNTTRTKTDTYEFRLYALNVDTLPSSTSSMSIQQIYNYIEALPPLGVAVLTGTSNAAATKLK